MQATNPAPERTDDYHELTPERVRSAVAEVLQLAGAWLERPEGASIGADVRAERTLRKIVGLAEAAGTRQRETWEHARSAELVDWIECVYAGVRAPFDVWDGEQVQPGPAPSWGEVADDVERAFGVLAPARRREALDEATIQAVALDTKEIAEKGGPREAAIWAVATLLDMSKSGVRKRLRNVTRWEPGEPAPGDGTAGRYFGHHDPVDAAARLARALFDGER